MGKIIRLSIILAIITLISSFGLAKLYQVTKPQIELIKKQKLNDALKIVLPEAGDIVAVSQQIPVKDPSGKVVAHNEIVEFYIGYKDQSHSDITGYAMKAIKAGFETKIETIVGINGEGVIQKIKIIDQKETPGLGARCVEDQPVNPDKKVWTTEQFIGKTRDQMKVDKDGGEITSITGATITSRAVTASIKEALDNVLAKIQTADSLESNITENSGE